VKEVPGIPEPGAQMQAFMADLQQQVVAEPAGQ
jgi:hypothetical protein